MSDVVRFKRVKAVKIVTVKGDLEDYLEANDKFESLMVRSGRTFTIERYRIDPYRCSYGELIETCATYSTSAFGYAEYYERTEYPPEEEVRETEEEPVFSTDDIIRTHIRDEATRLRTYIGAQPSSYDPMRVREIAGIIIDKCKQLQRMR